MLKKICNEVLNKKSSKIGDYASAYLDSYNRIHEEIRSFRGNKTDIHIKQANTGLDIIKPLLVFSDFVSLYTEMSSSGRILLPTKSEEVMTISVPDTLKDFIDTPENLAISHGFITFGDEELKTLIDLLGPLQESGRLIVRPTPVVMTATITTDNKPRTWKVHHVDPDSPSGNWLLINESKSQGSLPVKLGEVDTETEVDLFDVVIPYIDGISFKELSKILDHESDHISLLRVALVKAIKETGSSADKVEEICNDIIRPELDRLNIKFKSIVNMHSLKIAGAVVGTASVTLASLGTAAWMSSAATILGAGGVGLIAKEVAEMVKSVDDIKNSPFYLLWRLRKLRNKR